MEQVILNFFTAHPSLLVVVTILLVARAIFKPTMTWLHSIVEATPTKSDDEVLANVERSKAFRAVSWFFDYLLSIKLEVLLPKKAPPAVKKDE